MTSNDTCEFCSGPVQQQTILARFHFRGRTLYIDHVPAWVCTHCGEQYFDAPVYKAMEQIAQNSARIEKTICFPLAEYSVPS
jgi:YgiT-type zinc finger domain-containing protein